MSYKKTLTQSPQDVKISSNQIKNAAGGYVFPIEDMARLERFLILGSLGGTYYTGEQKHTYKNLNVIEELLNKDGFAVVDKAVEISDAGRAPKNDHAILVLAMAAAKGKKQVRWYAWSKLQKVCRTGTHYFQFIDFYRNVFGGKFGTVAKREASKWMLDKTPDNLAFQMLKYRNREGWSWRDVLRLVRPTSTEHNDLFRYIVAPQQMENYRRVEKDGKQFVYAPSSFDALPDVVSYFEVAQSTPVKAVVKLIKDHQIPREFIPTQHLNDPDVWEAMLPSMPPMAMIRNLGKMSSVGILGTLSANTKAVVEKLLDVESLKRNRIHPISVLVALKQYGAGHGLRGSLTWKTNPHILAALEDAFYLSFASIEPTGKNIYVGVDSSGSMQGGYSSVSMQGGWGSVMGLNNFAPAEAAAAMGMSVIRSEKWSAMYGFDDRILDPKITANTSLRDAYKRFSRGGRTDASLPFQHAQREKMFVDLFVIITDNETWYGHQHPVQALREYRQKVNPAAKLMVMAVTATGYSICDPKDPRQIDVAGFDSSVLTIMQSMAVMK